MNLFLIQLSDKYPDKFILLISDCAPAESESALKTSGRKLEINPVAI